MTKTDLADWFDLRFLENTMKSFAQAKASTMMKTILVFFGVFVIGGGGCKGSGIPYTGISKSTTAKLSISWDTLNILFRKCKPFSYNLDTSFQWHLIILNYMYNEGKITEGHFFKTISRLLRSCWSSQIVRNIKKTLSLTNFNRHKKEKENLNLVHPWNLSRRF